MPSKRLAKIIISSIKVKNHQIKVAWVIILFWLIILTPITVFFSSKVMEHMSSEFSLTPRGSESAKAEKILTDEFPPENSSLIAVLKSVSGFAFDALLFNETIQAVETPNTTVFMNAILESANPNFMYGLLLSQEINSSITKRGIGRFDMIVSPFFIYPGMIMSFPHQPELWQNFWEQMFFDNNKVSLIMVELNITSLGFSEMTFGEQDIYYGYIDELREKATKIPSVLKIAMGIYPNTETKITGSMAIAYDSLQSTQADRERMDVLTIILVIIILLIVFRSLIAPAVPLLTMGPALLLANTILYFLGSYIEIMSFAPTMVTVLGLGVGVDYSIFIFTRFLDELREGKTREDATTTAVMMSGRAILSSGLVVMMGFGALLIPQLELIQSIGLGVIIAIICGLFSAFTLLPALLYVFGEKITWPRKIKYDKNQNEEEEKKKSIWKRINIFNNIWGKFARFSIRFSWPIIIAAIIITVPFIILLVSYKPSYDILSMLPPNVESSEAFEILDDIGMTSELYGNSIVLSGFTSSELWSNNTLYAIEKLADWLLSTDPILGVETITRPSLGLYSINLVDLARDIQGTETPYLSVPSLYNTLNTILPPQTEFVDIVTKYINWNQGNNTLIIKLNFNKNPMSPDAMNDLRFLRRELKDLLQFGFSSNIVNYIYGGTSVNVDMSDELYSAFPLMVLWIIITIMAILTILLGSITVPIRLITTIFTSVTWTLGFLILIFQFNLEAITIALLNPHINVEAGLYWIIPPILFCILFGLGMDYDIFITSRIREFYLQGKTNSEAIEAGLTHTASVVTSCAVIMAGAFFALWFSYLLILTEIGLGMVFAVIVDASLVRVFLVPSAMAIMDKYNWWPEWINQKFGKLKH